MEDGPYPALWRLRVALAVPGVRGGGLWRGQVRGGPAWRQLHAP